MSGGNGSQLGPGLSREEAACLHALAAGRDAWQQFIRIYGSVINAEFARKQIYCKHTQADLLQELALKLVSHDCIIIRRFLERNTGLSFCAVLRPMITSIVIDEWRRWSHWRKIAFCEDEPTLRQLSAVKTDGDPALEIYREMRLISLLLKVCGTANKQGFLTMYLRFIDELPVELIGTRLGVSANAVSQRIAYYLKKLRKLGWSEVHDG